MTPWIGERYAKTGRVLILGESSWGIGDTTDADYVKHWLDHPNFLKRPECADCVRFGRARHAGESDYPRDRLNDALTRMILEWRCKTTDAKRRAAWAEIAFTNFVTQPRETLAQSDRPTKDDWAKAKREFPARLRVIEPRVCLGLDNPSGQLLGSAQDALDDERVAVVRLAHPTMRPAPKRAARLAAWRAVLDAATRLKGG